MRAVSVARCEGQTVGAGGRGGAGRDDGGHSSRQAGGQSILGVDEWNRLRRVSSPSAGCWLPRRWRKAICLRAASNRHGTPTSRVVACTWLIRMCCWPVLPAGPSDRRRLLNGWTPIRTNCSSRRCRFVEISEAIVRLERTGSPSRAAGLRDWLVLVLHLYGERVLPFDASAACLAGRLMDEVREASPTYGVAELAVPAVSGSRRVTIMVPNAHHHPQPGIADIAVAAIAESHDLTISDAQSEPLHGSRRPRNGPLRNAARGLTERSRHDRPDWPSPSRRNGYDGRSGRPCERRAGRVGFGRARVPGPAAGPRRRG